MDAFEIQRNKEEPHMFYRVPLETVEREYVIGDEASTTIRCFNQNKELFSVAKAALTMNLITAVLFIIMIPLTLLALIYQNCSKECGDCENYLVYYNVLAPMRILSVFFYLALIRHKINKKEVMLN